MKDATSFLQITTSGLVLKLHLHSGWHSNALSEWQLLNGVSVIQSVDLMVMGPTYTSSL